MQIHDVYQGSSEWHALRASHHTASEAPAMLGVSKYQTRSELLQAKATGITPEVSEDQQRLFDRGHEAEAAARPIAEGIIGEELYPATVTAEIDGLPLLASVDGMTMGADALFEHKLWSEGLAAQVEAGELEEHYTAQMDQQLALTGAARVLFMCSDGTEDRCAWMWYEGNPDAWSRILNGWRQFIEDMDGFTPAVAPAPVAGVAPETLPALRIEMTGMVTHSNLEEFRDHAFSVLDAINTDLQTDQDFADADKTVKWAKDVESRLDAAKDHALSQAASIDELFRVLDSIKEEARSKRLQLEKLVKARKEALRSEIVAEARAALDAHLAKLAERVSPLRMPEYRADFAGAIKGKRTVSSLRDAADTVLAQAKIDTSEIADGIAANLRAFDEIAGDGYRHLFPDLQQIVTKPADDFAAAVRLRIADHEAAEENRRAAEAERQEAKRKAAEAAQAPAPAPSDAPAAPTPAPAQAEATRGATAASPLKHRPTVARRPPAAQIAIAVARAFDVSEEVAAYWLVDTDFSGLAPTEAQA